MINILFLINMAEKTKDDSTRQPFSCIYQLCWWVWKNRLLYWL